MSQEEGWVQIPARDGSIFCSDSRLNILTFTLESTEMNEQLQREAGVHGQNWGAVHGGYFSDPAIAAPLIGQVRMLAEQSRAARIVDLGGGTGFLLSQLRQSGLDSRIALALVDESEVQVGIARQAGFHCVQRGVEKFSREELGAAETGACLWMMRSVLHYFGETGLRPALRHLRRQARPGEFFVHQTASFQLQQDADCLNELYRLMNTPKWYPTIESLRNILEEEGWEVRDVLPAAPLPLTRDSLAQRYHLAPALVQEIQERLLAHPASGKGVFDIKPDGFCAYLHYATYVCAAKRE